MAPTKVKQGIEETKYCRLHKCHELLTDECIHLKDAIEILIQRGPLKQFTKNPEPEKQTLKLITDGKNKVVVVAMSVEQLDEVPKHVEVTLYLCTWEA